LFVNINVVRLTVTSSLPLNNYLLLCILIFFLAVDGNRS